MRSTARSSQRILPALPIALQRCGPVTREDVFGKTLPTAYRLASRKSSAIDSRSPQAFIEGAVTSRDFSDLKVPHTAITTDFDTGEVVPLREGELISAVMASAAIPAVFPAVERDGRRLVDGGVGECPHRSCCRSGAQTIVVLDCGFTVVAPQKEETLQANLLRMAAIMALTAGASGLEKVRDRTVLYLPGPWPIGSRPMTSAAAKSWPTPHMSSPLNG